MSTPSPSRVAFRHIQGSLRGNSPPRTWSDWSLYDLPESRQAAKELSSALSKAKQAALKALARVQWDGWGDRPQEVTNAYKAANALMRPVIEKWAKVGASDGETWDVYRHELRETMMKKLGLTREPLRLAGENGLLSVEVRGPREILELIENEAEGEFRRGVRRSNIRVTEPSRRDGRVGAHLMLIIEGDKDEIIVWCKEQASYNYGGDLHEWRVRDGAREVSLRRAAKLVEHFKLDGQEHRVRGLSDDSGVRFSQKPGMRKWVLEHRTGRVWYEDAATYLPNSEGVAKAKKQLGV